MTYRVITDYPVATDSPDHLHPFGTARDNFVCPEFNAKLFDLVPCPVVLDLGCAGGGFVHSIIKDGGDAVGIEGSDYSQKRGRAEWATIPENLFTADITKRFEIVDVEPHPVFSGGEHWTPVSFNVITAWEVLEHIREEDLSGVLDNIRRHLAPGGRLIMSINTLPSEHEGAALHQTVKSRKWWRDKLNWSGGYEIDPVETEYFGKDWMRQDCLVDSLYGVWGKSLPSAREYEAGMR